MRRLTNGLLWLALLLLAVDLFAQTPTPTCPPIFPTCIAQFTPSPTQVTTPPTPTHTQTPGGPTATRTRTRTPTLIPTATPTPSGSACTPCGFGGVVCDLTAFQYNYSGTWNPDFTGAWPLTYNFRWPRQQDWHGPGNYTMAFRSHNPLSGWGCITVQTFYVSSSNPAFSPYIEALYDDKITGGCNVNPLVYCPMDLVTRAQMAVFIEKAIHIQTPNWTPPPCVGVFADVPCMTPTPTATPMVHQ